MTDLIGILNCGDRRLVNVRSDCQFAPRSAVAHRCCFRLPIAIALGAVTFRQIEIRSALVLPALRLGLGASVANPNPARPVRVQNAVGPDCQFSWRKTAASTFCYGLATPLTNLVPKVGTARTVRIGNLAQGRTASEESGADWLPALATDPERAQALKMPSGVAN